MPSLTISQKVINEVHFRDLEMFIREYYEDDFFSIVEAMEYPENDTCSLYSVAPALCEAEEIQCWLAGACGAPRLTFILDQLCREGILDAGEYLISVCW